MAIRHQLSRRPGWKKPPGAVVVGRPTRWGNPWRPEAMPPLGGNRRWRRQEERRRAEVVVCRFKEALLAGQLAVTVDDVRRELKGKDLLCWCALEDVCHADVLLEIANQ